MGKSALRLRTRFPTCSTVTSFAPPSPHSPPGPLAGNEPDWLSGLNPPQREAVLTTDGPVLMLAGAGTGKTAALTARLANLLRQRLAYPSQILCVTFTNKAAREMRERVGHLIGPAVEGMPWLGTFHSIAAKMLRRHAELVGLTSSFTIIDTDDQLRLLKQLIQAEGVDDKRWPAKQLAGLIDRWKNRGLGPDDLDAGENEAYANGRGAHFYRLYQDRLRTINACDFGDLLLHILVIFRQHRDVLESWQDRFRYIMVDEYQDTNAVQYLWLRLLAQVRKNICVVGDDDQSIYSWRGAEVANILRFEKDFPGAKVIRLEQNYRSTPHILGAASGLIAENAQRLGKQLWTERDGGDKLRVIGVWDAPEEARRVGEEIERLEREGCPLDRVAILVRAQFQTREFEDRFIQIGLAYRIVGGFRFYERAEIRDALAYLRLVGQPSDDLAFERIYNTPKRGLGDKTLEKLFRFARANQVPLLRAAYDITDTDELPARARNTLAALVRDFLRWREQVATLSPAELARTILDESGYTAALQAEKTAEANGRLENLSELVRAMEEYETLGDFLEHVSLVMDNEAQANEDKVTIMTIHAAKGLEFDQVFLPGWEEGVFPSQRALDEGGLASLEEERRLAYVAITRARRRCTILNAANRRIYGQWTSAIPSRFIEELPEDHIEQETTLSGGASMWRANWSEASDPFADVARNHPAKASTRGPGWQRAAAQMFDPKPRKIAENTRSAASFASKPRADLAVGARVFHDKFGYGTISSQEGNKLEIQFDSGGEKRVLDSFVKPA
ncbi:Rep family ATP-dependent DNA helicase [Novosphingobium sp. GV055]|uniref:ATP-dependent helicase n=1 Tax=Novosphingobium sp. GV055 TaxID=2135690 RepID=UPI000D31F63C|nr:UvrD-helicase domain-containing protein [Novosphingobium sp. GV055]PTR12931.1 Rep family ATP-dependent DNA helicase [Novosphingobium sp. GV055]PUB06715.1 Rep family ATP-dependent DNA helicase [Novosphingobium sp. GV061]PUB22766.1 Rep family ATP-dependent DNA helicase [Novosphingobium sp. GV079]PUB44791.1 Rep family ATP-dependent DNA helicase [Novosphingobium sp. GV027]